MNKCYLVGAGDFVLDQAPESSDLIIAADGGYDSLVKAGLKPDLIIGDMDSIKSQKTLHGVEVISFPVKKDETDMHLGYIEGAKRGYTDFVILGGTGGREDHTFANYSLLLYIKERGHSAILVGRESNATVIKNEAAVFRAKIGKRISVFAFGSKAEGVFIEGLLYSASGVTLTPAFPLGVSNSFVGTDGRIHVENGALLIIFEKGVDKISLG